MADRIKRKNDVLKDVAAYAELIKVYDAWLCYLLARMGEREVRVGVADITERLGKVSIIALREGDEYVIRVDAKEVTDNGEDERQP